MKPNQPVVTSYCVGRVLSYDHTTKIVHVLHRLSEHSWVVKQYHKDAVMEYCGIMWTISDAFR